MVNIWINVLGFDFNCGVEFVELFVVGVNVKFMKLFIDNGMRFGIVDLVLWVCMIMIYENVFVVNWFLGFFGWDEIWVLIVL